MGSTQFGNFENFCRDSTLPICNALSSSTHSQTGPWGGCTLTGIPLSNGQTLGNVGVIIISAIAFAVAVFLFLRSERKRAAVGRREMQLFLVGYMVISICEIFTIGEISQLPNNIRLAFTGIHLAFITATTWILLLNAVVGYQVIDDGTFMSLGLMVGSAGALLIGTGYIALDTGFSWTHFWDSSYTSPNRNIALYVLYQLAPLVFLVVFFVLEAILVLRVLGEVRPMIYLTSALVLFALGQIFTYVVSPYICSGTSGKIDGSLFESLFTLFSVVMIWVFWSSITEDDWPMPGLDQPAPIYPVSTTYP